MCEAELHVLDRGQPVDQRVVLKHRRGLASVRRERARFAQHAVPGDARPDATGNSPSSVLMKVVLPAPERPNTAHTHRCGIETDTRCSTSTPPRRHRDTIEPDGETHAQRLLALLRHIITPPRDVDPDDRRAAAPPSPKNCIDSTFGQPDRMNWLTPARLKSIRAAAISSALPTSAIAGAVRPDRAGHSTGVSHSVVSLA